jgi:hypothetical protein
MLLLLKPGSPTDKSPAQPHNTYKKKHEMSWLSFLLLNQALHQSAGPASSPAGMPLLLSRWVAN